MRSGLLRAAAVVLVTFIACESPFEPRGDGERVPIDVVIEDVARSDSVSYYSFVGHANQPYVVFLEALNGHVALTVFDSTHQFTAAGVSAVAGGPALAENPTYTFGTPASAVYQLSVRVLPPDTTARYRFKVYPIRQAPEIAPESFTIGDTVSGETIDPRVDIDRFSAAGVAGQEIVLVAETPGPAGSGSVAVNVVDTVTDGLIGYVFADAGTSNPLTSGRMRLSGTHDYVFVAGSVISNTYPRYRGPYRFWTYVINRAPEHRSASLNVNTEIGQEHIDREGDVDEFTFTASVGQQFNVFLQASRAFQLEVARPGTSPYELAAAVPGDTGLFDHATDRFSVFQAGTQVVRVLGSGSHQVADTGSYRIYVYAIDPRPEHVPAAFALGDTVSGEQIELPGDVDEFTFSGIAGEEVNTFFQAEDGTQRTFLQLDILDPAGSLFRSVQSSGTDTSLFQRATGTLVLPTTGTYRVRVRSEAFMDQGRGPYRFFFYRINRAPESAPATLALGDSLVNEAINLPGDVDEFVLTVPASTLAGLTLTRATGPSTQCVQAVILDAAGHQLLDNSVPWFCNGTPETSRGSGPVALPAGSHLLRVQGGGGYVGAYGVRTFPLDSLPESLPASVAIGDTVSGEGIGKPGDYDVFAFSGRSGQHIDVFLQGLAAPLDSNQYRFVASVRGPSRPDGIAFTNTPLSTPALASHRTGRIDLPETGAYRVTVYSGQDGHLLDEVGPYRFAIATVPAGPETAPVALAPGDSVTTERIDGPEDVDEFVLTGTPEQEVAVFLFSGETQSLTVVAYDTATGAILDGTPSFVALESTGRFRLPISGVAGIRVYWPRPCPPEISAEFGGCSGPPTLGTYFLRVVPINRAPETVSATVVVGDTVNEAIDPRGDVDEFTVTGTQGQHLIAYLQTPQGSQYPGLVLQVIDTTSGAVLGSVASLNPTPALEGQSTGSITLPYTGAYTIRVQGADDRNGAGQYRFKVVLQ